MIILRSLIGYLRSVWVSAKDQWELERKAISISTAVFKPRCYICGGTDLGIDETDVKIHNDCTTHNAAVHISSSPSK